MSQKHHFSEDSADLSFLLITVSTTRSPDTDTTGEAAQRILDGKNLKNKRMVVKDDEREILLALLENLDGYDCFVYMGGTGLSRYDITVQSVRKIAEKEVTGFGELFRSRSGNKFAYLSGASMFSYRGKLIFCLPGSPDAQETGFQVISELVFHAHHEANRK